MIKKKSILAYLLAFCLIIPTMFMLSACGHKHTFSDDWSSDKSYHWHSATCEHKDEKIDYAEHTFGSWLVKTPAGIDQERIEERKCSVCDYSEQRTIANTATHTYSTTWSKNSTQHWKESTCNHTPALKSEVADHTFSNWKVKTPAGVHQDRIEERKCSVCDYSEQRTIANTATHTYSTTWSKNSTQHWKESTCNHTPALKSEVANHTFSSWTVKTPAGVHQDRIEERKCSVCDYSEQRTIANTATHTYSTTWSKNSTQHWKESTCNHTPALKSEVANHTFSNWAVKTPAGVHQDRVEERKCSVCKYSEQRTIANTATHTYSTTWSKNSTQHWKESTCNHTPALKSEVADHTFSNWTVKTPADYGVNRVEMRTCTVCGFEDEKEIENSALAPKTNNVSVEAINLTYSGKKQSIDSFITVDNNTGMVVEYEGINGTIYEKSTIAPINAGTYEYTITIPATAEFAKGEKTGEFKIEKYRVVCPDIFVTELNQGQEKTTKLCEIDLTDKDDINLDEVELIYSSSNNPNGIGASRMNVSRKSVKVAPAYENNIEVVIPSSKQTIEWIVLDGNDVFSLLCSETITAGSCYKGTITHGFVKVGDKLMVLDYNSSTNKLVKVGVTVTQIEHNEKYTTNYHKTPYATKGETVKITFTKDNASDNISSVRNIVSAQDIEEINENAGYKSKTVDLSLTGSEFRMLKLKVNSDLQCKLSVSNTDNCKLLKVFNATTGEEITLTENTFQVAEGIEVYIIIQQGVTSGTQQVKAELI